MRTAASDREKGMEWMDRAIKAENDLLQCQRERDRWKAEAAENIRNYSLRAETAEAEQRKTLLDCEDRIGIYRDRQAKAEEERDLYRSAWEAGQKAIDTVGTAEYDEAYEKSDNADAAVRAYRERSKT